MPAVAAIHLSEVRPIVCVGLLKLYERHADALNDEACHVLTVLWYLAGLTLSACFTRSHFPYLKV